MGLLLTLKKKLLRRNGSILYQTKTDYIPPKAQSVSSTSAIIYNKSREQIEFDRIIAENEQMGIDTNL